MQLFYFLNSLAGRSAVVDAAMRFFYVSAVPLLWTALFAVLILAPRAASNSASTSTAEIEDHRTRRVIAMAAAVVLAGSALSMWATASFARQWLGAEIYSPRPFVTHWVNLLVVEPNDNSFPCPETILAAGAATLIWAATIGGRWQRAGAWAWGAAAWLALTRVFCGTNYPIDVAAGLALGWAWAALPLAMARVTVWRPRHGGRWHPEWPQQAALSGACIGAVALIVALSGRSHTARGGLTRTSSMAPNASNRVNVADGGREGMHEGEGAPSLASETQAPQFAAHYGRQPLAEAHLRRALSALKLPLPLSDLEVAQVQVGDSPFRVAQARFEVPGRGAQERQRVARIAAALIKTCFRHDAALQNVDVTAVVLRPVPPSSQNAGGADRKAVPVFTASVSRRNLVLTSGPLWANAPGTDPGLWLRARSQLYIDPQILPSPTKPKSKPAKLPPRQMPMPAKPLQRQLPKTQTTKPQSIPPSHAVKKPARIRQPLVRQTLPRQTWRRAPNIRRRRPQSTLRRIRRLRRWRH